MLVDLADKNLTGKDVEKWLDAAHITCNKNTIPNDPQSPFVTSGIRLGTAAVTTRGFNEADLDMVADAIAMIIAFNNHIFLTPHLHLSSSYCSTLISSKVLIFR